MEQLTWLTIEAARRGLLDIEHKLSGGENFASYLAQLQGDGQSQCTTVWTKMTIAYRCRTCQVNDSSAICVSCFQAGDHRHHDYVMYHSDSGGCCDCGDPAAWQEAGFCSDHSSSQLHKETPIPVHLTEVTCQAVEFVLQELCLWVDMIVKAKCLAREPPSFSLEVAMAEIYMIWLQKICSVTALRTIICREITVVQSADSMVPATRCYLDSLLSAYAKMPAGLMEASPQEFGTLLAFLDSKETQRCKKSSCWETTLFLQMLYDQQFKEAFSRALMRHYMDMILPAVMVPGLLADYKNLEQSLDRVMVQLFNVPEITLNLIQKDHLLECVTSVFSFIVNHCSRKDVGTVDVEHPAIKQKVYGRPQGDLKLILAHESVALHVLKDRPDVFQTILTIWSTLQWMKPCTQAETGDFGEQVSWTEAITLEINAMAITFGLVTRCFSAYPGSGECARMALVSAACLTMTSLREFIAKAKLAEGFVDTYSLHVPLHRTFCAIISKLVLLPWGETSNGFLSSLQPALTETEVLDLMDHPLRVIVWMAQIRAQTWRNSSEDFSRLELIYRGSIWHAQSMDMDILMLQFCSVAHENIGQSVILKMAQRFDLLDMVTRPDVGGMNRQLSSTRISMLHDFLQLFLLIVRERRNTGMSEKESLRSDIIQWLCVRDRTYSQLVYTLSGVLVEEMKLSCVLDEVAIYNAPKLQERGFYQLRPECWKEFDPLFAHFYLNDLEEAQERALSVGKLPHYWRLHPPREAKAPFKGLIRLLHTQACHQLIWNVLHSVTTLIRDEMTATSAEGLGVMALQILAMALVDMWDGAAKSCQTSATSQALQMKSFSTQHYSHNWDFIYTKPHVSSATVDGENGDSYPSIYEMLSHLHQVKDSLRLVDSVDFVLDLLSSYTSINSSLKMSSSQVLDASNVDERHKLKKQRQEAILADFAARQKAFLEVLNEDNSIKNQELALEGAGDAARSRCEPRGTSSLTFLGDNISLRSTVGAEEHHECAFCRSECDGNESPTGWIALVQRYNLPSLLHSRGEVLTSVKEVASLVSEQGEQGRVGWGDVITVMSNQSTGGVSAAGCLDLYPTGHVRCCGHQMHQACFQRYAESLLRRHYAGCAYEGRKIIDLGKLDFLCPICRRLANVLLPDVNKVIPGRILRTREGQDWSGVCFEEPHQSDDRLGCNLEALFPKASSELYDVEYWKQFWHRHENLAEAIGTYASQCLRVKKAFLKEPPELKGLLLCQTLWETFAENIIHCEVETRGQERAFRDIASSSSRSGSPENSMLWRSDAAHGRALMELGKLALLTNTIPSTAKQQKRLLLLEWIGFEESIMEKLKEGSTTRTAFSEQVNKLLTTSDGEQEQYSQSSKYGEPVDEVLQLINTRKQIPQCIKGDQPNGVSWNEVTDDIKDKQNREDSKVITTAMKDIRGRSLWKDHDQRQITELVQTTDVGWLWNEDSRSSKCGVIASGDPFELLVMLLVTVEGWPTFQEIMTMVRVTYVLAATQASVAFDSLRGQEGDDAPDNLKGKVVLLACLPFLRRVAILIQILAGRSLNHERRELDFAAMDSSRLQESLNLPSIEELMELGLQGSCKVKVAHQWRDRELTAFLYRSPRQARLTNLPEIFQELVLQKLEVSCSSCRRIPCEPAICLVCGNIFCFGTECCKIDGVGEWYRHAEKEGAGIGLYLLMRSTQLVLLRSNRVCMAPSLYLDLHGEEDALLKRGHPLHLSHLRLDEIKRLWLTAAFDYDTHILHTSQLGGKAS